jgi:hypothetical protein
MSCSSCILITIHGEYQECTVCGERKSIVLDEHFDIVGTTLRARGPNKSIQSILYESNIKDSTELKREKLLDKLRICKERHNIPISDTTIHECVDIYINYSKTESKVCKSSNKSKLLSAIIHIVSALNKESLDEKKIKLMFQLDESFYPAIDNVKAFMKIHSDKLIECQVSSLVTKVSIKHTWTNAILTMVNTIIKYDLIKQQTHNTIIKACVFDIDMRTDNVTDFAGFLEMANIKTPTLIKCLKSINSEIVYNICKNIYKYYDVREKNMIELTFES